MIAAIQINFWGTERSLDGEHYIYVCEIFNLTSGLEIFRNIETLWHNYFLADTPIYTLASYKHIIHCKTMILLETYRSQNYLNSFVERSLKPISGKESVRAVFIMIPLKFLYTKKLICSLV